MNNIKEKLKIIFKQWKQGILVFLFLVIITIFYFILNKTNPFTGVKHATFLYGGNIKNNTSFACNALLSSNIVGSTGEYVKTLTNGVEGSVKKGTDKIAMSIENQDTLILQTSTNVSFGVTEGDRFQIIQNDNNQLMAAWFNENVISTVVINKKNGLAIWTKGNPNFLIYDAPYGSMIYMTCQ